MKILKYLKEIKKILADLGCEPSEFSLNCRNRYMICGDIIAVEAKMTGIPSDVKYGYFLISIEDKELLNDRKFVIQIHAAKKFVVSVTDTKHLCVLKGLITGCPRRYVYENNNPLDLRRTNLKRSNLYFF